MLSLPVVLVKDVWIRRSGEKGWGGMRQVVGWIKWGRRQVVRWMDGGRGKGNLGERLSKKLCFFVILILCKQRGEK